VICADSSVFIQFFRNVAGREVELLAQSLKDQMLVMNPFVLTELLTASNLKKQLEADLIDLQRIQLREGFFERAGFLRRLIYTKGSGVSLSDTYIAQACIDSNIPFLTTDGDFKLIAKYSDLRLIT
jgi:predicted nucleic acid-binding protein